MYPHLKGANQLIMNQVTLQQNQNVGNSRGGYRSSTPMAAFDWQCMTSYYHSDLRSIAEPLLSYTPLQSAEAQSQQEGAQRVHISAK